MSPRLKVSNFVVERLSKLEDATVGFLLGTSYEDSTYVLGIVKHFNNAAGENSNDPYDLSNYDIVPNLPANIHFCGVFNVVSQGKTEINFINELCNKIEATPVVLSFDLSSNELTSYKYENNLLERTEFEVGNDLLKSFLHLRVIATIPLACDFQIENVQEAFDFIHEKIINGNSAFRILDSDVYILGGKPNDICGVFSESTLDKVYSTVKKSDGNRNENGIDILNVSLYLNSSTSDQSPQPAPYVKYIKKVYKHATIELPLDSLAIAPKHLTLKQLHPILVESVSRNLTLNKHCLVSQLSSFQDPSEIKNASLPQTFHFFPPNCSHFVSIVYPEKHILEELKKFRETFHSLLCLPMDRPLFRKGNEFDFSKTDKNKSNGLILNPHEGLSISGVPDGEACLVQGTYAYYHYKQDEFDDSGWGCAYRSLQTIFSWFRFQGYTNMPVPNHKEIQQCLVNIGDKPSSFVGSNQWIGSTEVSFVLDTMLGVTCRIVNVSSGEEMSMKGGELSYHFKTQGTPVMIGGGVLAHTILGVDYNKRTGAIKFLILDPHYTGEENLKIIKSKGWCGWKGPEFWKKDAFYNMCLPLIPKCV